MTPRPRKFRNQSIGLPRVPSIASRHGLRSFRGRGFTLIEIAVCLVILGLLTGLAALSLRGVQRNVDMETWVERVAALDRQARDRAERQGQPWRLVLDVQQQRIWNESTDESGQDKSSTELGTPQGWELAAVQVHRGDAAREFVNGGQDTVLCATHGVSPSYAIELRNEQGESFWLMVAGGSGQWTTTRNEQEIQDIFAAL